MIGFQLITSYFVLTVPYGFAKIYAKKLAIRENHLVLEVNTLMVRNIVEGVHIHYKGLFYPCSSMQLRLTPSSRKCKEILRTVYGNSNAVYGITTFGPKLSLQHKIKAMKAKTTELIRSHNNQIIS
jgi:hypothetical protein